MVQLLSSPNYSPLALPLLELMRYESGLQCTQEMLLSRGKAVIKEIDAVIAPTNSEDKVSPAPSEIIAQFFEANEAGLEGFRGKVARDHPSVKNAYTDVERAAAILCDVVGEDFTLEADLYYDQLNNAIHLKIEANKAGKKFITANDRNHKPLNKRSTTPKVEKATGEYLAAVERAVVAVKTALQELSETLKIDLPVMVASLHITVVVQAADAHVAEAIKREWCLPQLSDDDDDSVKGRTMIVEGLVTYWMDRAGCVGNTFDFKGIFLLTAPNMSGKSTLMRSVAVAALLGNCGLYVPCNHAVIPRYDNIFVRTASYDVPTEDKSAFALEMDDVRVMLRDSSRRSLLMLDEIGKGTSARDGSALSGALIEELDSMQVSAIFATHLHEIFDLGLQTQHVTEKRMGMKLQDGIGGNNMQWTYLLEDGRCTDSMALATARRFHIPANIIKRAEELGHEFDQICRKGDSDVVVDYRRVIQREAPEADGSTSNSGRVLLSQAEDQLVKVVARYWEECADRSSPSVSSEVKSRICTVGEKQEPPPFLEGHACVYILGLPDAAAGGGDGLVFYVGETESIRSRLNSHRKSKGGCQVVVLPVKSKTEARTVETLCIREFKRLGYPLLSDSDGTRKVLR